MKHSVLPRRFADAILPTAAFILPPLAVFAPLGVATLFTAAALLLLSLDGRRCIASFPTLKPLALLLAALGIWAVLSASWSILPEHSLLEGLRLLFLSAGGIAIVSTALSAAPAERRHVGQAVMAGAVVAMLLLLIERFGNLPLTWLWLHAPLTQSIPFERFDRGVTVLVLSLWPAFFALRALWQRAALVLAVVALAAAMASTTALLAALVSLATFVLARFAPRLVAGAMIAFMLVLGAAIPLATLSYDGVLALHQSAPWIKWSGIHRLLIWRFAADRAAERPFLGWGMDAAREIPGGKTEFNAILPTLHYPGSAQALPLHPHDAALQWQLELGVPGLLLGLAVVTWVIGRIGWQAGPDPTRRAGALALAAAVLTVGLLSFGVWQAWWLSTIWLVAALAIASGAEDPGDRSIEH